MNLAPGTYSIDVPAASDAAFTAWKAARQGNVGVRQAVAGLNGAPNHYIFTVATSTEWGPWTVPIPNPTAGAVDASAVMPTTAPSYPTPASPVDVMTGAVSSAGGAFKTATKVATVATFVWIGWEIWKATRK